MRTPSLPTFSTPHKRFDYTLAKSVPMLPAQLSAMFPKVVRAAYVAPSDPSGHIRRYCRRTQDFDTRGVK